MLSGAHTRFKLPQRRSVQRAVGHVYSPPIRRQTFGCNPRRNISPKPPSCTAHAVVHTQQTESKRVKVVKLRRKRTAVAGLLLARLRSIYWLWIRSAHNSQGLHGVADIRIAQQVPIFPSAAPLSCCSSADVTHLCRSANRPHNCSTKRS